MFTTLYSKLVATLLVVVLPLGVVFVVSNHHLSQLYQQEVSQKLNRELAAHIAADVPLFRNGRFDSASLEHLFHNLMVINPSIELYGLNTQGRVEIYSAPSGHVKRSHVSLAPIRRFLAGEADFPLVGDDPRDQTRQKVFSAAELFENGERVGYLYIVLASETYDGIAQMLSGSHSLRQTALVSLGGIAFSMIAGLVLLGWITIKLRRLSNEMDEFAAKNSIVVDKSDSRIKNTHGDDLDKLRSTFHNMAKRITDQLDSLRRTDATRREMIANVSHDLRTPLASLNGYLETVLIKKSELSVDEQHRFIEIAAKHSRHLGQLIEELFELAKLDSVESLLHCEPVALPELIQDITQKFTLAAQNQGVTLELRCERNLPYVAADIGLIGRALENLIENALRYTPNGGTINIEIFRDGGQIAVRVSDTGCGIEDSELPKIFDRFYRIEKSRQNADGAGLGLAIVKRIVELHGSTIQAASKPQQGTTFSFSLPVCAA